MVYKLNDDGNILRTIMHPDGGISIETTKIHLNWHFAYQLPLAILALYSTAGMDISKFIIPAVGIWAIAWANHYN